MVPTCSSLFGHFCDWHAESHGCDHAQHLENHWDIGDPGVQLATLDRAQRVGERDKKEPTASSTSSTQSRKQNMIEETARLAKNTCLQWPLRQLRRTLLSVKPLVTVGHWTLGGETNVGPTNAAEAARLNWRL